VVKRKIYLASMKGALAQRQSTEMKISFPEAH